MGGRLAAYLIRIETGHLRFQAPLWGRYREFSLDYFRPPRSLPTALCMIKYQQQFPKHPHMIASKALYFVK